VIRGGDQGGLAQDFVWTGARGSTLLRARAKGPALELKESGSWALFRFAADATRKPVPNYEYDLGGAAWIGRRSAAVNSANGTLASPGSRFFDSRSHYRRRSRRRPR